MSVTKSNQVPVHHRVRTFFSSIFGLIALWLIMSSIFTVWLNRTLTDTNTYVATVEPLVSEPAVQAFIVTKATDQLLQSAPTEDLATTLLPTSETAGKNFDELTALVRPVITDSLQQIVSSPSFRELWKSTNRSAHTQLMGQLKAGSAVITLDLSPAVTGALDELTHTKLAPISNKIEITPGLGKFDLKGGSIERAHQYYTLFQQSTLALICLTILFLGLSIIISVHHVKTFRRIIFGAGISSIVLAGILAAPSIIQLHSADPVTQAAAIAIAQTLFHGLQLAGLAIGIGCLVVVFASKIYEGHTFGKLETSRASEPKTT